MAVKSVKAELVLDNLKDAFWRVTTADKKGASMTKVLSHETFVNMLKSNTIVRKDPKKHRLGSMPYGYVDCLYGGPGTYTVAVVYPEKVRGIKYFKDAYLVPYPNTLYIYQVSKGVVVSKHCFAVKTTNITDDTELFRFPFGNVGRDGGMCYGNIRLPDCTELSAIDEVVELFLSGDVNDDLYGNNNTTKDCKQYELLQSLAGKKKFPSRILTRAEHYGVGALKFKDVFE